MQYEGPQLPLRLVLDAREGEGNETTGVWRVSPVRISTLVTTLLAVAPSAERACAYCAQKCKDGPADQEGNQSPGDRKDERVMANERAADRSQEAYQNRPHGLATKLHPRKGMPDPAPKHC